MQLQKVEPLPAYVEVQLHKQVERKQDSEPRKHHHHTSEEEQELVESEDPLVVETAVTRSTHLLDVTA